MINMHFCVLPFLITLLFLGKRGCFGIPQFTHFISHINDAKRCLEGFFNKNGTMVFKTDGTLVSEIL